MKIGSYILVRKKAVEDVIVDAMKKGVPESRMPVLYEMIGAYNSAIFGICIYRTWRKWRGIDFFNSLAAKATQ